jgi:hypothetical protein
MSWGSNNPLLNVTQILAESEAIDEKFIQYRQQESAAGAMRHDIARR